MKLHRFKADFSSTQAYGARAAALDARVDQARSLVAAASSEPALFVAPAKNSGIDCKAAF